MSISVFHAKTLGIPDDADTTLVRPSDWMSSHLVTFSPDATEVIKVISAGAQSVSSGSVVFANSNGVTFGMNAGTITASVPAVGGAQTGISGLSAGTTLATSGTVSFGNSNGISFGINGNTLTASYTVPVVPAQTSFVLSNSNNVSFGTNGLTVTATATFNQTVQTQNMVSVQGSTGAIVFQNGNGVSFGGNASTVTASVAAQTVDTRKAGTGFSSAGLNIGLSGTLNTDGFSLSATVPSAPAQTVQPVAISGSNGSFAFSTVTFGNSNGASFYSTNGSIVASYTVPNVPAQTNQTIGLYAVSNTTGQSSSFTVDARSLTFEGAGVASVGYSNGSVVISVPAGGGGGDGFNQAGFTNSTANSTMSLVWAGNSAGSGNVTVGLTGSTITMSAPSGAGGGGAALSAGTQSVSTGTVAFANSNGISFGMSGSNQITASYTVPTIPGATVFSNSNNVSFGLAGSTVTATATWPVQTVQPAVAQLNGSSGTLSLAAGSSLSASSNGSTITFGLASNITTALQSAGAYLTTAAQVSQVVNSLNGSTGQISLNVGSSLSASSNGSSITFGLVSNITTALQSAGAYLTTAMASNAGSNFVGLNSALTANGISATINSSGVSLNFPAFLTTAAQVSHSHGNPTLALTNLTGTTASASNGFTLSLSAAAPGAGGGIALGNSQTTYTSGTVALSEGGGAVTIASTTGQGLRISVPATSSLSVTGVLSMSVNGNTISLGAPAAAGDGVNVVMLGTTNTTGTAWSASTGTVQINGSGGIVISQNNSNQLVVSYSGTGDVEGVSLIGNVAGNSTVAPNANTLYLSGGNNVTLSGTGNTVVISAAAGGGGGITLDKFAYPLAIVNTQTQFPSQSTNFVWPVQVPINLNAEKLKLLQTVSIGSSSFASTANTTFSFGLSETHHFGIYTRGSGANSQSLYSVSSTTFGRSYSIQARYGSASNTQQSHDFGLTYMMSTGTSSFSTFYSTSNLSTLALSTGNLTALTGIKFHEAPLLATITEGEYWLMYRVSSTTATQGTNMSGARLQASYIAQTQINLTYGSFGAANNASIQAQKGVGSFTTAGGATTSNLNFSNISSSASHPIPYVTFVNID